MFSPQSKVTHSLFPSGSLGAYVPDFLAHAELDLRFSRQSIVKYRECLDKVMRLFGTRPAAAFGRDDLHKLKRWLCQRQYSPARQASLLLSLRRFLRYLTEECHIPALDPKTITIPKRPRRAVAYLTVEEVNRFLATIPLVTRRGVTHSRGLRFRALVEVLLGSAMRISEVLSLNRADINFEEAEARVIGKGNKERVVFFTDRALDWIATYLKTRKDSHPALFAREDGKQRLQQSDVWRPFKRYREQARIEKKITPHLLRHTAATQLLFRGCPIGHIKEILGHERLETTCRYYLGLDHRAAKQAHRRYLQYT